MKVEPLVAIQPGFDLGVLVGCVVVDDQVQVQIVRRLGVDLLEEFDEFLVAVPRHALPDQTPFQHVQSGQQCGGAVQFVVMGQTLH